MHENFVALEQEKRDRIINAAMREFSSKGYKNASTNEIVKKAEISKGALFHYFQTKLDLYEFLYRYGIDYIMSTTAPRIKDLPTDVFKRWVAFAALKIEIALQYPDMAEFMQSVYYEEADEAVGLIRQEIGRFSASFQRKIYDGIDMSKFRPDVDTAKAFNIIWWVLEGYALAKRDRNFEFSKIKNPEFVQGMMIEIDEYLSILKKSFYKEEYWT